jgi:drug/metabolite transporter (DMT)-like permease
MSLLSWFSNRPLILVVLATLFWAGNAIAGKIAVGHISPFLLTSLRWLVALMVLMPFAFNKLKSDWQRVRPRLIVLLLLGTLGFTLFNNLMYSALAFTSAINVAIIQSSLPLFVFVVNAFFFAMAVNKFQAIGFPITLIGVLIVTFQGHVSLLFEQQVNSGDVLMLLAVMAYGVYSVFLSKKPDVHWLSTMTVLASGALIASIPFVIFEGLSGKLVMPDVTGMSVVLYAAIFASIGAQAFWIRSVELIGANATSMFINLVPLFGALLAVIVLGEQLYMFHVIGFSLIVSGIYVAQLRVQTSSEKS